ncbi:MAG: hypothetical protein WAM60_04725 [Candidatus Promineifilaceae bacterium]
MALDFSSTLYQIKPEIIGGWYRLLDQLGKGGMGSVFRVFDRLTGKEVAFKRILANDDLLMAFYDDDSANDPLLSFTRIFGLT